MPNLAHVLVHSFEHLRTGHIINNARELAQLERAGAVVLPVDDDLVPPLGSSSLDGFFIKSFGAGWLATKGSGERCCPMVLHVLPDRNNINWVARVIPSAGQRATGRLRLMADTTQSAFTNSGLSQQEIPDLIESIPLDEDGGWTLRGRSTISVTTSGVLAVAIHAVTRNARIQWSAVSLSSSGAGA